MPGDRFGTNLGCILDALGHLWCHLGWSLQACGSIWARLVQAVCPIEPFDTPVGRKHGFRKICWMLGPESWRPVAACGDELRPSGSPIEEDKMIRFKHPGTQILDSSCLGSWVGFLDFSCLATWACWTDGLFWPLLRGVGVGKGLDVVGKEV